jgi:large conductance mechanosensitive channel
MPTPVSIKPVNSLWQEFKTFAFKGNMIDLAVGVVIGAAFGRVVSSLVDNIFMPLLAAAGAGGKGYESWSVTLHGSDVKYGLFIGAVINFLIIAAVIFLIIVKLLGTVTRRAAPAPAPSEPVLKECPFCLSQIPTRARKCSHCTADLPSAEVPAAG